MRTTEGRNRRSGLKRLAGAFASVVESIVWGGDLRERFLLRLLAGHYRSRFRRDWIFREEAPHFFANRISWFFAGYGDRRTGAFPFLPGIYSAAVLQPADQVLDIGCGDGFYVGRFYAPRCARIDAIDLEPSSIAQANAWYRSANVRFAVRDAFAEPFPSDRYDVIFWDGGLGHVSRGQSEEVLHKIAASLLPGGVFSGSESLGDEGHDHLQFFPSLDDMASLLRSHFRFVELIEHQYETLTPGFIRREGYWRCANDPGRLQENLWHTFDDNVSFGDGS